MDNVMYDRTAQCMGCIDGGDRGGGGTHDDGAEDRNDGEGHKDNRYSQARLQGTDHIAHTSVDPRRHANEDRFGTSPSQTD